LAITTAFDLDEECLRLEITTVIIDHVYITSLHLLIINYCFTDSTCFSKSIGSANIYCS
jgi:hypothetical protein